MKSNFAREELFASPPMHRIGMYEYPAYYVFLEQLLLKLNEHGYFVLDAGCGEGYALNLLPDDTTSIGIDRSVENVLLAKKAIRSESKHLVVGDIEYLPFKAETFDLIFCRNVVEHVNNRPKAVSQCALVLRRKGSMLLSTSNLLNLGMMIDSALPTALSAKLVKKLSGLEFYERTSRFNPWSLIKNLRKEGLRVTVVMLGTPMPPVSSNYVTGQLKPPLFCYPWIVLDKITNFGFLRNFKEMIIVLAQK